MPSSVEWKVVVYTRSFAKKLEERRKKPIRELFLKVISLRFITFGSIIGGNIIYIFISKWYNDSK